MANTTRRRALQKPMANMLMPQLLPALGQIGGVGPNAMGGAVPTIQPYIETQPIRAEVLANSSGRVERELAYWLKVKGDKAYKNDKSTRAAVDNKIKELQKKLSGGK